MTDRARLERMSEVCAIIVADVKDDTDRREGQPFDGRHVAAAMGEICAQVGALAGMLKVLIDERIESTQ